MIHIEVDYQGPRSIETYSFTGTGKDYHEKLDEIKNYKGKIDSIKVSLGTDRAGDMWDHIPAQILFQTTHVGLALKRARKIQYPQ